MGPREGGYLLRVQPPQPRRRGPGHRGQSQEGRQHSAHAREAHTPAHAGPGDPLIWLCVCAVGGSNHHAPFWPLSYRGGQVTQGGAGCALGSCARPRRAGGQGACACYPASRCVLAPGRFQKEPHPRPDPVPRQGQPSPSPLPPAPAEVETKPRAGTAGSFRRCACGHFPLWSLKMQTVPQVGKLALPPDHPSPAPGAGGPPHPHAASTRMSCSPGLRAAVWTCPL